MKTDPTRPNGLSRLSNEALLAEVKRCKPSPWFDAFFIGFLVGVIVYGAAANAWGFVILLPLFLIYLLLKKPKHYAALKKELEDRGIRPDGASNA